MARANPLFRTALSAGLLMVMAGCSTTLIPGFPSDAASSSGATLPTSARPEPDSRGVITYPSYQIAIARSGETVEDMSDRLGLDAPRVARTNGLPAGTVFSGGEVVLLPSRVPPDPAGTGIASVAGPALDRAEAAAPGRAPDDPGPPAVEPIRHTVQRGETAFSIARLYNVSPRALADWNGLDDNLTVREGQVLLIPLAAAPDRDAQALATAPPGEGTPTPQPPSASTAQPDEDLPSVAESASTAAAGGGTAANLNDQRTAASDTTRLLTPVSGRIIRGYDKRRNEGLDFAAPAGAQVIAADEGTVAAITRDVEQVPIIVIRHSGNLLTVYANVDDIKVEKGSRVRRGQQIAVVREADQPFLHFEVRQGFDSVDPVPYLTE